MNVVLGSVCNVLPDSCSALTDVFYVNITFFYMGLKAINLLLPLRDLSVEAESQAEENPTEHKRLHSGT